MTNFLSESLERFEKLWRISVENKKGTDLQTNVKLFLSKELTSLAEQIIEEAEKAKKEIHGGGNGRRIMKQFQEKIREMMK